MAAAGGLAVWDTAAERELQRLSSPGGFQGARFSPNGKTLAALSADGTVRVRALATSQETRMRRLPSAVTTAVFSPDGSTLASAYPTTGDNAITLWRID